MIFRAGSKVVHSLHGLGVVESIEEKDILGKLSRFSVISFQEGRLKIMVNVDQGNNMIRPLIDADEVGTVMDHLRQEHNDLPTKTTERYQVNLNKIKSGDIYALAAVVKNLIAVSYDKKLSPKEQQMLKQSRRILAQELAYVTGCDDDEMEQIVDHTCRVGKRELVGHKLN
ncbi:MAG: hypothetical protein HY319_28660 [Armatimonadetes bacterium]|nr:hypothetical protein [Armatimonadota bacterium]